MSPSSPAAQPRAKQACESCRRKKTKCPGEKPVCSFCQRLGQRCTYESSENSSRVHKPHNITHREQHESSGRVQRLESRMDELYDLVSTLSEQLPRPQTGGSTPSEAVQRLNAVTSAAHTIADHGPSAGSQFHIVHCQEPSKEVIADLIQIYQRLIDHQPLLLFIASDLSMLILKWPKYLRRSFFTITVPFCNHTFFDDVRDEAVNFYRRSARQDVFSLVADGMISLEILQSLCLLAQSNIIASNSSVAWMDIAMGVRLALSAGFMPVKSTSHLTAHKDEDIRCCWSLFILDRIYSCSLSIPPALIGEEMLPSYPRGVSTPSRWTLTPHLANSSENGPQQAQITDLGITAYCLQMLSMWADAMSYIKTVKAGTSEDPWLVTSGYHVVNTRFFQFETRLAQTHRFQKIHFDQRSSENLNEHREYWTYWLMTQFLFHTIQGMINHPFIHIAGKKNQDRFQPPSFMQGIVDQAILHAGWILKLINTCKERGFVINDPFMGHLVAVNATIFLFLVNAKDPELALQASAGFDHCFSFVNELSIKWSHLQQTLEKLRILHRGTDTTISTSQAINGPKVQSSLLWELLDYSASTRPSEVPELASDAVNLDVATRFLSPLNPLTDNNTPAVAIGLDNAGQEEQLTAEQPVSGSIWEPDSDSYGWNLFDNEQMASFTNSLFGRDLWNVGHL